MKDFYRKDFRFSLCGLNCGLCPMQLGGYCPGCGGGPGNQSCAIARCSLQHGGVEYCCHCADFPCGRYEREDEFDSFISHRNRLRDLERLQQMGVEAYQAEQREKVQVLSELLESYNGGRQKSFFCTAVNLLPLADLRVVMEELASKTAFAGLSLKEKSVLAAARLQAAADARGILLRLRKRPAKGAKEN